MTSKEEKHAANLKRILDAATTLFFERGYSGTTMEAICSRLEVTKPFIYWYFKDKAAIFDTVCLQSATITLASLHTEAPFGADVETRLREGLRALIHNHVRLFRSGALYYREASSLGESARSNIRRMAADFHHELVSLLQEGMDEGVLSPQDPKLTALAIGGIAGFMYTWYHPHGPLEPKEIAERLVGIMLRTAGLDEQRQISRRPKAKVDARRQRRKSQLRAIAPPP